MQHAERTGDKHLNLIWLYARLTQAHRASKIYKLDKLPVEQEEEGENWVIYYNLIILIELFIMQNQS